MWYLQVGEYVDIVMRGLVECCVVVVSSRRLVFREA